MLRAGGVAIVLGLLLGCGDGTGPAATITVTGTVFYDRQYAHQPTVDGATVVVNNLAPVTTDRLGQFSVAGVKTPYRVVIKDRFSGEAVVYVDLTRDNPILRVPYYPYDPYPPDRLATVSGTVSMGAGVPKPASATTEVIFASPEAGGVSFLGGTGAYEMKLGWYSPAATTGSIHALQWGLDPTTGLIAYTGYGTRPNVALSDGDTLGGQDIELGPVTTGSLNGTVTVPSGYTLAWKELSAVVDTPPAEWNLLHDTASDGAIAYATPSLAGMSFTLEVFAWAGDVAGPSYVRSWTKKTGLTGNENDIAVSVPEVVLGGPADGATGVAAGDRLSWSRMSDAVYLVRITGSPVASGQPPPPYVIFTADTTATIPDLSSLGLGLGRNTGYDWYVTGFAPLASLDDLTMTATFPPPGDWSQATSPRRHFVTAP